MTERERLIELLLEHTDNAFNISEDKHFVHSTTIGKIADTLLSNGVICPPCRTDREIYRICEDKVIRAWDIVKMEIFEDEIGYVDDGDNWFTADDIGKTVFLTKEEAERVLRKGNENG